MAIFHEDEVWEGAVMVEIVTSGMTHLEDREEEVRIGIPETDSMLVTGESHRLGEIDRDRPLQETIEMRETLIPA